jgi:hypothetical protein
MLQKTMKVALAGALGLFALVLAAGTNGTAADDKAPTCSAIMRKCFKDKDCFQAAIPAAAKGAKWDDAGKLAKEWVSLSEQLVKTKPKKNADKTKMWEEQCATFVTNAKAVQKACDDKDAKAVGTAVGNKAFGCAGCHSTFK